MSKKSIFGRFWGFLGQIQSLSALTWLAVGKKFRYQMIDQEVGFKYATRGLVEILKFFFQNF